MLKAANKRIVVKKEELKDTSGIEIPESIKVETPTKSTVVSVGDGIETPLKVGDIIYITKYGGHTLEVGDEEFTIIKEDDLLAVEG